MILGNYFIKLVFEKEEGALARSLCKGYPLPTPLGKGGPYEKSEILVWAFFVYFSIEFVFAYVIGFTLNNS